MSGFIRQQTRQHQGDVVCKKRETPAQKNQPIENSMLGREPSCCLQDSPAAVFRPASAVSGDFAPPARGGPGDISSNSPGSPRATSADSPSKPAGTPDRKRSSADDNRSGVGSGRQAGCKPVVADDRGQAERLADSNGNGDPSSGGSRREWKRSFSLGAPFNLDALVKKLSAYGNFSTAFPDRWGGSCFSLSSRSSMTLRSIGVLGASERRHDYAE